MADNIKNEQTKDVTEKKLIIIISIFAVLLAVMVLFGGVFIKSVNGVHLSAYVVDSSALQWKLSNNTFYDMEATDVLRLEKYEKGEWIVMQTITDPPPQDDGKLKGYGYSIIDYYALEFFNNNNFYQKYRLSKTYKLDGVERIAYYEFEVDGVSEQNEVTSIKTVKQDGSPNLFGIFKKKSN